MSDRPVLSPTAALPAEGASNSLIRNTFILLSLVLGVSAVGAFLGLALRIPLGIGMWLVFMALFIGGPFLIQRIGNGQAQIMATFGWAFAVGLLFSPLIGGYLSIPGGASVVMNAFVTTAVLFVGLAAYAVTTRKDFSFMAGFLFAGLILALIAIVANIFLQIPMLSLVISSVVVLLMCACILFEVSRLIHEPNANPVMITVSLFGSIVVLFSHLLNLFNMLSGDD